MIAIALQYIPDRDQSPRVVASGKGSLAYQMLSLAHSYQIPVHKDLLLAETVSHIPVGKEIPENLYRAVASVFSFLYKLEPTPPTPQS